jgi:hypothetical protein
MKYSQHNEMLLWVPQIVGSFMTRWGYYKLVKEGSAGGSGFKSRSGDQLSGLKFIMVSFSPSTQSPG